MIIFIGMSMTAMGSEGIGTAPCSASISAEDHREGLLELLKDIQNPRESDPVAMIMVSGPRISRDTKCVVGEIASETQADVNMLRAATSFYQGNIKSAKEHLCLLGRKRTEYAERWRVQYWASNIQCPWPKKTRRSISIGLMATGAVAALAGGTLIRGSYLGAREFECLSLKEPTRPPTCPTKDTAEQFRRRKLLPLSVAGWTLATTGALSGSAGIFTYIYW